MRLPERLVSGTSHADGFPIKPRQEVWVRSPDIVNVQSPEVMGSAHECS